MWKWKWIGCCWVEVGTSDLPNIHIQNGFRGPTIGLYGYTEKKINSSSLSSTWSNAISLIRLTLNHTIEELQTLPTPFFIVLYDISVGWLLEYSDTTFLSSFLAVWHFPLLSERYPWIYFFILFMNIFRPQSFLISKKFLFSDPCFIIVVIFVLLMSVGLLNRIFQNSLLFPKLLFLFILILLFCAINFPRIPGEPWLSIHSYEKAWIDYCRKLTWDCFSMGLSLLYSE